MDLFVLTTQQSLFFGSRLLLPDLRSSLEAVVAGSIGHFADHTIFLGRAFGLASDMVLVHFWKS